MSGPGDALRQVFENQVLDLNGAPLTIYKNWGTEQMVEAPGVAIRENNVFLFAAAADVERGNVIQLEGTKSFFRVDDVDEELKFGVVHHLNVRVTKIDELGKAIQVGTSGHAVFYGAVTGGVQIGNINSTQTVTITTNPDLNNSLEAILKLVKESKMDELDKEDGEAVIKRIGELADKPKSEGVLRKLKEKFDFLESLVKTGKLAVEAGPYIALAAQTIGLA